MSRELVQFMTSARPDVMLIINHGYGGAKLPSGDAPDTGGQHVYVQALARSLETLGYRVTIVARGGFPFADGKRQREGQEWLSPFIRYLFVPGGGDAYISKEEIAVAIDEEAEWLASFVRGEAATRGCQPWEVYQVINSHYWDGALLAVQLVERWRNGCALELLTDLFGRAVPARLLERERAQRHWNAVATALPYHVGRLLLEAGAATGELEQRAGEAARLWHEAKGRQVPDVTQRVANALQGVPPPLTSLAAADCLGRCVLEVWDPDGRRRAALDRVDRHVWTPHSLGPLDEQSLRDQPPEVRRGLKFCERRSHERVVCERTRAFASTSAKVAEYLHTHFDVPVARIFDFPPGVDRSRFRAYADHELDSTYAYLSEHSGVPAAALRRGRIVFEVSRMERLERKDLLLAAFSKAAKDLPNAFLFIAGGPDNDHYRSLARRRDADPLLAERAFFLLDRIPDDIFFGLFSAAALYCTASEKQGFGISLAQAAAAGTAAVASNRIPFAVQYVPDAVKVIPAGDTDGFAVAMRELLEDPVERRRRGELMTKRVAGLEWKTVTRNFLQQLQRWGMNLAPGKLDGDDDKFGRESK